MNRFSKGKIFLFMSGCLTVSMLQAAIRPVSDSETTRAHHNTVKSAPSEDAVATDNDAATSEAVANPSSTADDIPAEAMQPAKPARSTASGVSGRVSRADAFIAGPDWEFDGFVSGGQDSKVRSMFYLNDLLYLNIGSKQGIVSGDKLEIYKRGDKVNDPQTGHFLGYEVRRAAVVTVTDRVEDDTCAVRIVLTHEPVEIGDLVRRLQ
jgi:hypothetical protein